MGQAKSAARFAKNLKLPVAAGNKERISDSQVVINGLVGNKVRGHKRALVYDDEIATGGSILELSRLLIEEGVENIHVICTHGVFSRGGLGRLAAVPEITQIVTTDTVYVAGENKHPKLTVLSVAPVFADAIRHNINRESLSELFVYGE
jgi:ribose-phosphate pyrophosphokinase